MTLRGKIKHASRQSDLSRWLRENHGWFRRELEEAGVPNWDIITKLLCDAGLTDRNGNPYNKDAVRIGVKRFLDSHPKPSSLPIPTPPPPEPAPEPTPTPEPQVDLIALSKAIKDKRTLK